jgi:hypothetical protein
MADVLLFLWDISVAVALFGFGLTGLRLLKVKAPLAVAGTFGVSLWISLGAYLNLFHLLRPAVFFAAVAVGVLLAATEFFLARRRPQLHHSQPAAPLTLTAKLLLGAAILLIGTLMLGGMKPLLWCVDDLQGYAAMAVKAAQLHSIQPDFFSERRVQAGVGGGNFLDTFMLATGDLRAMSFIDSTFGYFLYALALWSIGRRWKVPPAGIAFALLVLPFASLMKVNLTIIYLSAAAFFAILLLLDDQPPSSRLPLNRIFILGVLVGAACTTKSPNIVFLLPFLGITALFLVFFQRRIEPLLQAALVVLVAIAVILPWSIANKPVAGTYLYPLLGLGIHISAYHVIPVPSQLGVWPQMLVVIAPNMFFLAIGSLVAWKLTRAWQPDARAAAMAYLLTALLATPITVIGLGGQGADRYTAPIVMPALLLILLIVLHSADQTLKPWRRTGLATLSVLALYIVFFLGNRLGNLLDLQTIAAQARGAMPKYHSFLTPTSAQQFHQAFDYGARIQASIPTGATALSVVQSEYPYDFRRNNILIADWPGLASPPPGLRLDASPAEQRQFFVDHGIQYIIFNPPPGCSASDWDTFFPIHKQHFAWDYFLIHEPTAHDYKPWEKLEIHVTCHERHVIWQIVQNSPQVFNDGHIVVARID